MNTIVVSADTGFGPCPVYSGRLDGMMAFETCPAQRYYSIDQAVNHDDLYPRHRVSRTRRTMMGVRIVLAEGEPLRLALRRFKKEVEREAIPFELRRRRSFISATAVRRATEFKRRFKAREVTMLAKMAREQPTDLTASELLSRFWDRTGKP